MASFTRLILAAYFLCSMVSTLGETQEEHCVRKDVPNSDKNIKYLLRLQWLPGQCMAISTCVESKVKDDIWTIHGLWAARFCTGEHAFKKSLLTDTLRDKLNKYWVDIKTEGDNRLFWECEYKKHGCATNWQQLEYFKKAIKVYHKYNPGPMLARVGVTPGEKYSSAKFKSAFETNVLLKCNKDNSINELEFCLDGDYKAIDCDEETIEDCSDHRGILYFTKNQEQDTNKKIKMRNMW